MLSEIKQSILRERQRERESIQDPPLFYPGDLVQIKPSDPAKGLNTSPLFSRQ
jgi:hypothetical protein